MKTSTQTWKILMDLKDKIFLKIMIFQEEAAEVTENSESDMISKYIDYRQMEKIKKMII